MKFEESFLIIPLTHHTWSENFLQLTTDHLAHELLTDARQNRIGPPENYVVPVSGNGSHDHRLESLQALDLAQNVGGLPIVGLRIVAPDRDVARVALDRGVHEGDERSADAVGGSRMGAGIDWEHWGRGGRVVER